MTPEYAQKTEITLNHSIETILSLTTELETLMATENECLNKMDHEKFIELQSTKASLAKNYELEAQKIILLREKIKEADGSLRDKLKTAHDRFEATAEKNMSVLVSRKNSVKKLNERILNAAKEQIAPKQHGYTQAGAINKNAQRTISTHAGEMV